MEDSNRGHQPLRDGLPQRSAREKDNKDIGDQPDEKGNREWIDGKLFPFYPIINDQGHKY